MSYLEPLSPVTAVLDEAGQTVDFSFQGIDYCVPFGYHVRNGVYCLEYDLDHMSKYVPQGMNASFFGRGEWSEIADRIEAFLQEKPDCLPALMLPYAVRRDETAHFLCTRPVPRAPSPAEEFLTCAYAD